MVIFSHRYLDSDRINFKTFVFLAVFFFGPSEHHHSTQISMFNHFLNGASTMLNHVLRFSCPDVLPQLQSKTPRATCNSFLLTAGYVYTRNLYFIKLSKYCSQLSWGGGGEGASCPTPTLYLYYAKNISDSDLTLIMLENACLSIHPRFNILYFNNHQ